jgi:uncharacterized metal-binding protein
MPDGIHHENVWKAGAIVAIPATLLAVVTVDYRFALGLLAGYGMGRYFTPDLDQVTVTTSEGRLMNDFKILGYVIVGYTTIYGAMFRRWHRSFITHFPVISTAIRLVFLFWWIIFFYRRGWLVFGIDDLYIGAGILFGMSMADSMHWLSDTWFSNSEDSGNSNVTIVQKGYNNVTKGKKYGK